MMTNQLTIGWFWVAAAAAITVLWYLLSNVLAPFVVGIIVAYLLKPVVHALMRLGCARWVASAGVVISFMVVLAASLIALVPLLINEMTTLAQEVPGLLDRSQQWIMVNFPTLAPMLPQDQGAWTDMIAAHLTGALSLSAGVLGGVMTGGQAALSVLTFLALMPIIAYFTMTEWPRILATTEGLIPRRSLSTVQTLVRAMDRRIAGFIRGQVIVAFMLGSFYAVALSLVGLNYAVLIGVVTGLLSVIPLVGSAFGLMAAVLMGLLQMPTDGAGVLGAAVAVFVVAQVVEGNFITPKIVGDRVGLHPLWIIFALLTGAQLGGLVGMMMAVPVAAMVAVLIEFAVARYHQSALYRDPVPPKGSAS